MQRKIMRRKRKRATRWSNQKVKRIQRYMNLIHHLFFLEHKSCNNTELNVKAVPIAVKEIFVVLKILMGERASYIFSFVDFKSLYFWIVYCLLLKKYVLNLGYPCWYRLTID